MLSRVAAHNARLNHFIRIDAEGALARARALDAHQAAGGELGPLHGVPVAHKDMYYRAGRVSTCGSRIRADYRPDITSTLLERLDAAGAVELGALNMTEFAIGPTGHNAVWGNARNPWNTEHITGGSSSGSGGAVAAGMAFASIGSDSGGSVRLPAGICGVVGLKPTLGRLSMYGGMGISFSIDTPGPLTRTVADSARVLGVLAGHDPRDPYCADRPVPDYEAGIGREIAGLRIGRPRNHFYEHCTAELKRLLDDSLRVFEHLGAEIVDVDAPECEHMMELSRAVLYPEGAALHAQWLRECPEDYSPQVRVRVATGFGIPAPVYLEALHMRPRIVRQFVETVFGSCDVLHTPLLSFPVPTLKETDIGSSDAMWEVIGRLCHSTAPFNYLGLPAMTVPAGFTGNGLPASFQLIAPSFEEALLFRAAAAYETESAWRDTHPEL
ncbi:MAG: amidase [Gammaproteobacteria bacterium]|nr:amidase [Gammaproteobacteria bacterium]NNM01740.1 amidase [Gammaproteobacteria bacterium]